MVIVTRGERKGTRETENGKVNARSLIEARYNALVKKGADAVKSK